MESKLSNDRLGMKEISSIMAGLLLDIEAVTLTTGKPFRWTSGILAPIYCDNRIIISYPDVRRMVADWMALMIKNKFPQAEVIAATATAGIPHGALIAERLDLPMVYVRSKAKDYGKESAIEGRIKSGQRVVVVEDLISTGKSSIHTVNEIKNGEGEVLGVTAIFNYNFATTEEVFNSINIPFYTLTDYNTLINVSLGRGRINSEDVELLKSWSSDPITWGK